MAKQNTIKPNINKFVGDSSELEVIDEADLEEEEVEEKELNFPQCIVCEHLIDADKQTCEAFPKKIPDALFFGDVSHAVPFKGDNGILFEPVAEILEIEE